MGGYRMPKGEVNDEFLSFLVVVIDADIEVALDSAGLHQEMPFFNDKSNSGLFDMPQEVDRLRVEDYAQIGIALFSELHVPVPFAIFRHRPIWIDSSGTVLLRESRIPSRTFFHFGGSRPPSPPCTRTCWRAGTPW